MITLLISNLIKTECELWRTNLLVIVRLLIGDFMYSQSEKTRLPMSFDKTILGTSAKKNLLFSTYPSTALL